jgi:hypothetical protein
VKETDMSKTQALIDTIDAGIADGSTAEEKQHADRALAPRDNLLGQSGADDVLF